MTATSLMRNTFPHRYFQYLLILSYTVTLEDSRSRCCRSTAHSTAHTSTGLNAYNIWRIPLLLYSNSHNRPKELRWQGMLGSAADTLQECASSSDPRAASTASRVALEITGVGQDGPTRGLGGTLAGRQSRGRPHDQQSAAVCVSGVLSAVANGEGGGGGGGGGSGPGGVFQPESEERYRRAQCCCVCSLTYSVFRVTFFGLKSLMKKEASNPPTKMEGVCLAGSALFFLFVRLRHGFSRDLRKAYSSMSNRVKTTAKNAHVDIKSTEYDFINRRIYRCRGPEPGQKRNSNVRAMGPDKNLG